MAKRCTEWLMTANSISRGNNGWRSFCHYVQSFSCPLFVSLICAHRFAARCSWIWPSLWYPGKPACFHDNVCRQNNVFVLSWIRSESVSSLLDTRIHTSSRALTVHASQHICAGQKEQKGNRKRQKLRLGKGKETNAVHLIHAQRPHATNESFTAAC